MIWVSYHIGCQLDEPCGLSGDHWQMQQCFNVLTDIYKVFFLVLFHCCILLEIKLMTTTITCEFNWLSSCLMIEWRGMNFVRVLQRSRRWTRHNNDRNSVLPLRHHQVQSIQDDPVLWWTEPKASSLSTEPGDIRFLCEQDTTEKLTKASTLGLDARVRSCAHKIGDKSLIGKLSEGDMIVLGAKYHLDCLGNFYRQAATSDEKNLKTVLRHLVSKPKLSVIWWNVLRVSEGHTCHFQWVIWWNCMSRGWFLWEYTAKGIPTDCHRI